ncbi:MAG: hypothetical protein DCF28_06435 [Alphaproteobacteria bacterium]|nr:MAG: hypothetical protein DCF28_06435 [Alphaproteobacteria bacterium]
MADHDPQADQALATYRAEIRAVGRQQRLAGFGLVLLGAVMVYASQKAGGAGEAVLWGGYAALAAGWALMLVAIFLRTRYHRRRMREMN